MQMVKHLHIWTTRSIHFSPEIWKHTLVLASLHHSKLRYSHTHLQKVSGIWDINLKVLKQTLQNPFFIVDITAYSVQLFKCHSACKVCRYGLFRLEPTPPTIKNTWGWKRQLTAHPKQNILPCCPASAMVWLVDFQSSNTNTDVVSRTKLGIYIFLFPFGESTFSHHVQNKQGNLSVTKGEKNTSTGFTQICNMLKMAFSISNVMLHPKLKVKTMVISKLLEGKQWRHHFLHLPGNRLQNHPEHQR